MKREKLENLIGGQIIELAKTDLLMKESKQLLVIAISSINTARKNKQRKAIS